MPRPKRESEFFAQYRRPEWQRKRLEVMERADYKCENCGAKDKTLNVHHTYYERDRKPWEYPDESLQCLCEECHRTAQQAIDRFKRQLGKVSWALDELMGYALGLEMKDDLKVKIELTSFEMAQGIAKCWDLPGWKGTEAVIDARDKKNRIDGATLDRIREAWKNGTLKIMTADERLSLTGSPDPVL